MGCKEAADTQQFSVTLPRDLVARIDALAKRRGLSRAAVLRWLAHEGMAREALAHRLAAAAEEVA